MNGTHATELLNKPSYLEVENKYRFLIFDAPTDENRHLYVQVAPQSRLLPLETLLVERAQASLVIAIHIFFSILRSSRRGT